MSKNKITANNCYDISKQPTEQAGYFDKTIDVEINENETITCWTWIARSVENEKQLWFMIPSSNDKHQCELRLYVKEDGADKWEFRG